MSRASHKKITDAFKNKYINHLTVTNTIPTAYDFKDKNVTVVDVSKFIASVTKVIFSNNLSLSKHAQNWFKKSKIK